MWAFVCVLSTHPSTDVSLAVRTRQTSCFGALQDLGFVQQACASDAYKI